MSPMSQRLLRPRNAYGVPRQISGLALWLNAKDAVVSGGNVTSWPDRSGRGFTATVYSGTPTYNATDMNGLPAVKFDGSSCMFIDASVHSYGIDGEITMFAAIKGPLPSTELAARRPLMCGGTENGQFSTFFAFRSYNDARLYAASATRVGVADVNMISSTAVSDVRKIMALNYSNGSGQFFLNGTQRASASGISSTLSAATTGNGRVAIGATVGLGSAGFFTICDFGEIIIYSRSLSTQERSRVTDYLSNLYAPQ